MLLSSGRTGLVARHSRTSQESLTVVWWPSYSAERRRSCPALVPWKRRPVHGPADKRRRVLDGRKVADSGAPACAAAFADGSRPAGAADPQLHPPRHPRSVRGPERGDRRGAHALYGAAPRTGFRGPPLDIDASVEPALEFHVVFDNLSVHKAPAVQRWLVRPPRVHFHFTPTYASWLNLVERFVGLLTEKALKRGSHTSIAQLRAAILAYVEAHNERDLRAVSPAENWNRDRGRAETRASVPDRRQFSEDSVTGLTNLAVVAPLRIFSAVTYDVAPFETTLVIAIRGVRRAIPTVVTSIRELTAMRFAECSKATVVREACGGDHTGGCHFAHYLHHYSPLILVVRHD